MQRFWNDLNAHCNQENQANQLRYVSLGNRNEVPAVLEATRNNQDAKNLLSFWGEMDLITTEELGRACRYLSFVQQALDKLDQLNCQGALNPWGKTGLFDRNHGITDSIIPSNYWADD